MHDANNNIAAQVDINNSGKLINKVTFIGHRFLFNFFKGKSTKVNACATSSKKDSAIEYTFSNLEDDDDDETQIHIKKAAPKSTKEKRQAYKNVKSPSDNFEYNDKKSYQLKGVKTFSLLPQTRGFNINYMPISKSL